MRELYIERTPPAQVSQVILRYLYVFLFINIIFINYCYSFIDPSEFMVVWIGMCRSRWSSCRLGLYVSIHMAIVSFGSACVDPYCVC